MALIIFAVVKKQLKTLRVMKGTFNITKADIRKAEKVLIDNGIDKDEADVVLQAIGYVLLDTELYPED